MATRHSPPVSPKLKTKPLATQEEEEMPTLEGGDNKPPEPVGPTQAFLGDKIKLANLKRGYWTRKHWGGNYCKAIDQAIDRCHRSQKPTDRLVFKLVELSDKLTQHSG